MKIYVDADACPNVIKEILYKAAIRCNCQLVLVANKPLTVRRHALISTVQVARGFDVADKHIADSVVAGDLVITSDIPLASEIIAKKATALSPRGELFTKENINMRLGSRDLLEQLRDTGMQSGGPKKLDQTHLQRFANELDRFLAKVNTKD